MLQLLSSPWLFLLHARHQRKLRLFPLLVFDATMIGDIAAEKELSFFCHILGTLSLLLVVFNTVHREASVHIDCTSQCLNL
jgi:hypothetical protein